MRAVGYGRVSTEEQANEGYSLEAQRTSNIKHIGDQGWTMVGYFEDPGFSGKNLNRPDVKRLLGEVEKKHIDVLVVHKLDRLTRDIKDLYDLIKLFDKHNVKFVSISEKIDTSTAVGRMFVFMLGLFAQWYRENLGEEVAKVIRTRVKKGKNLITVNFFGYTREPGGKLTIFEEQANWVKWMFEQYASGIGTPAIAKKLNAMGIKRNRGGKWDQQKVANALQNEHYLGKVHHRAAKETERSVYDGTHEGIITQELFDRVQEIFRRRREGTMSQNSYNYVFSGIVVCNRCGGKLKSKYGGKKNQFPSYICTNRHKHGTCDLPAISEPKLTALVFSRLSHDTDFTWEEEAPSDSKMKQEEVKKQIRASEARRERWQFAYGDGLMPYEDFSKLMREEMERVRDLEAQLDETPEIKTTLTWDQAKGLIEDMFAEWDLLEVNTKKQVVQHLLQQVVVDKDGDDWKVLGIKLA